MLPAASNGWRSQSSPRTRSLVDAGEAAGHSAAGIRTAIPRAGPLVEVHHPTCCVLQLDVAVDARTLQVGGRADVQPVGDLRGPGAEHLGAVATSDDEPSPRQGDRPRGHRPLGVPTRRGREHRARRPVELVEVERRQRLDDPGGPRRLDGAAQVDPGGRRPSVRVGRGEPRPPVGLSGAALVGGELRLVAVEVDLVREDPHPELVGDEPRLQPDRQERDGHAAGQRGDAGLEVGGRRAHGTTSSGTPPAWMATRIGCWWVRAARWAAWSTNRVPSSSSPRAGCPRSAGTRPVRSRCAPRSPSTRSSGPGRAGPVQLVEPEPRLGRLLLDDEEPAVAAQQLGRAEVEAS